MKKQEMQDQIEPAIEAVLDRLGLQDASPPQKAVLRLAKLGEELLKPNTAPHDVYRSAGLSTPEKRERFQELAGCSPRRFVLAARLELAAKLLESGQGSPAEVGRLVGYATLGSFRRAFRNYHGLEPADVLAEVVDALAAPAKGAGDPEGSGSPDGWRRAADLLAGGAAEEVLKKNIRDFLDFQVSRPTQAHLETVQDWGPRESVLARYLARRWFQTDRDEVSKEIANLAGRFQTTALFEYLLEQSRVEGRGDRERGVWIAELAVESLKGLTWRLSAEEMVHQRIRGLAYLGNALRLSIDFSGAEKAFSEAFLLANGVSTAPPVFQAEVVFFKACLRMNQRRREEALSLAENALTHLSRDGHIKLRVEAMTLIGSIQGFRGCWFEALRRFRAAGEQAKGLGDPYLLISVESGLVWANIKMGNLAAANVSLCKAFELVETLNQASCSPYLHWLKGIYAAEKKELEQATEALSEALAGFQEQKNYGYAAAVALELAIVLSRQDRCSEVLETASSSLAILKELELDEECLLLVATLEKAIVRSEVKRILLHSLRSHLGAKLGLLDLLENDRANT